jgi:hypothetical protein
MVTKAALVLLLLRPEARACASGPRSERSVLTYGHTWRRPEATLQGFLRNMSAAAAAGVVQAVAVEALSLHANGSLYALPTGSNATSLKDVVNALQSLRLDVYGWLLNVDKAVTCPMLRTIWANPAPVVDGAVKAALSGGWAGLVVDLEPPASGCFAKDGIGFVKLLTALRVAAHAADLHLLVYAEQWQYHGLWTLFDYAKDAAATDGCLIGLTYDGPPPIKPLSDWKVRLNYSTAAVPLSSKRWVGLSTDSGYDGEAIASRVRAAAGAGATRLHVFTDWVPAAWIAPLRAFLRD